MNTLITKSKEYLEEVNIDIVKISYLIIIAVLTGILIYFFVKVNGLSGRISDMEEEQEYLMEMISVLEYTEPDNNDIQLEILNLIKELVEKEDVKKD